MRHRLVVRCVLFVCVLIPCGFTNTSRPSHAHPRSIIETSIPQNNAQNPSTEIIAKTQFGGTYAASVLDDGYAYFTQGSVLYIVDTRDPSAVIQVGRIELPTTPEQLQVADDIVYAMGQTNEIVIIDATNHATPVLRSRYPVTRSETAMLAQGKKLYVADAGNFRIIDMSDPASPLLVGTYTYNRSYYFHFSIDGIIAYIPTLEGLDAVDISDPSNPRFISRLQLNAMLMDVHNNVLYARDSYPCGRYGECYTTYIYDVSDTSHPVLRKTYDNYAEVVFNDLLTIITAPDGIHLLDVQDPAYIVERAVYAGSAFSPHLVGTTVYFQSDRRFHGLDLSDPSQPKTRGNYDISNFTTTPTIDVQGSVALLRHTMRLELLDLTNDNAPRSREVWQSDGAINRIKVADDHVYWASGYTGIHVLDIADTSSIQKIGSYIPENPQQVNTNELDVAGRNVYIGTYDIVRVIDVGDPRHPVPRSVLTAPIEWQGLWVDWLKAVGDRLYVGSDTFNNANEVYIIDISSPDQLKILGTILTDAKSQISPVEIQGTTLYAIREKFTPENRYFLEIWDVSDPTQPKRRSQMQLPDDVTSSSRAVVSDGIIYFTGKTHEISSIVFADVSNPDHPQVIGSYSAQFRPNSIDVKHHLLYVHSTKTQPSTDAPRSTLEIVDVHDPQNPILLAQYLTPENELGIHRQDLYSRGGYIYLAESESGMQVLWYGPTSTAPIPVSGGVLTSDVDGTRYEVAAGTFTRPVTLTHTPKSSSDAPDTGKLLDAQHIFALTAVDSVSGSQLQPTTPFTATIAYEDNLFTEETEANFALYFWDGSHWNKELSSIADPNANTVTASILHTGTWAVLADNIAETYLPLVFK